MAGKYILVSEDSLKEFVEKNLKESADKSREKTQKKRGSQSLSNLSAKNDSHKERGRGQGQRGHHTQATGQFGRGGPVGQGQTRGRGSPVGQGHTKGRGGSVGQGQTKGCGGSVGQGHTRGRGGPVGQRQTRGRGGSVGQGHTKSCGGSVGQGQTRGRGGPVGQGHTKGRGGSVGQEQSRSHGGPVGQGLTKGRGGSVEQGQSRSHGGPVGQGQTKHWGGPVGQRQTRGRGGSVGQGHTKSCGGSVGQGQTRGRGGPVGQGHTKGRGGSVGQEQSRSHGGPVGQGLTKGRGGSVEQGQSRSHGGPVGQGQTKHWGGPVGQGQTRGRGGQTRHVAPGPCYQPQNQDHVFSSWLTPCDAPPSYDDTFGISGLHLQQPLIQRPPIVSQHFHSPAQPFHSPPQPFHSPPPPIMFPSNIQPMPRTSKEKSRVQENYIDVHVLVKELVHFNGFFTDVDRLSRMVEKSSDLVMNVAKCNTSVLRTFEDKTQKKTLIELCPSVKICENYLVGERGCEKTNCVKLHVCLDYAMGVCIQKNCPGNNWKNDHNDFIFKNFFLDDLSPDVLDLLLKKIFKGAFSPKICSQYQDQKCQLGKNCNALHICYMFVKTIGNCPNPNGNCTLNHNIKNEQCEMTFTKLGISMNDSPRDLLRIVASRPNAFKEFEAVEQKINDNAKGTKVTDNSENTKQDKATGENPTKVKKEKESMNANPPASSDTECKTAFSSHFHGNVEEPTVCFMGLFKKCSYLEKGCKFLHCEKPYHWQFGRNNKWYNFIPSHIAILENSFRDVNCDKVTLPAMTHDEVSEKMKDLFSLLGTKTIDVDFTTMSMITEGSNQIYSIRHVTTVSTAIINKPLNTVFNWYFKNHHDQWEKYVQQVSEEIEKPFLDYDREPSSSSSILVNSNGTTYEINFQQMHQRNMKTNTISDIRRRPLPFPTKGKSIPIAVSMPKHWEKMGLREEYKLIKLKEDTNEYMEVHQIVLLTLPMINIVSLFRVQNQDLWMHFVIKKKEILTKYNEPRVNTQKLFVSIDSSDLVNICKENLDCQKHFPDPLTLYGKGTYFYNSAAEAAAECQSDDDDHKLILVADVIIGKVTEGSFGLQKPPFNPTTNNLPFDTTVNSTMSPTVFVKYNKEEYYPSYVIEVAGLSN